MLETQLTSQFGLVWLGETKTATQNDEDASVALTDISKLQNKYNGKQETGIVSGGAISVMIQDSFRAL